MYICTYSTYCSIASSPTSLYLLLCTPFSILLKKIFITVKKTRVFLCQVKMIMKIREIVLKHPSVSRSTFFFSWEMAHRRKHFKIYSIFFLTSILLVRQQQQWIAREGQKGPSRFGNFAGFFDKFFFKEKRLTMSSSLLF